MKVEIINSPPAEAITSLFPSGEATMTAKSAIEILSSSWTDQLSSSIPSPILSPAQRESIYRIEAAFATGLSDIDRSLLQWQSRVSSGRLVGRFDDLVKQLQEAVLGDFRIRTAGCVTPRERADRQKLLQSHLTTGSNRLLRQQLAVLESQVTKDFRQALLQLLVNSPSSTSEEAGEADAAVMKEQQQQQLRKSVFQFQTKLQELAGDGGNFLDDGDKVAEMRESLQTTLKEFPETSAAKLEEVKKIEREAKSGASGRKKKRFSGIPKISNVALSLVGMLRPPGHGSLQGFVGYATSMVGLPLDLLLGFHNDGDSPEVMGEDREYPILRVQPKINFDIDL